MIWHHGMWQLTKKFGSWYWHILTGLSPIWNDIVPLPSTGKLCRISMPVLKQLGQRYAVRAGHRFILPIWIRLKVMCPKIKLLCYPRGILWKLNISQKISMAKALRINSCTLRLKWAHVSLLFWRDPFLARLRTERYLKWNAEVWWCYSHFFWVAICLALFHTIPRFLPLPLSL